MTDSPERRRRSRRWLWITVGSGGALGIILLALASRMQFSSETLRQRVVATLSERFDADVELQELRFRAFPRFHAKGAGLTIRQKRHRDMPPLISIKSFEVHADAFGLWRKHIAQVTLHGLEIDIPPGEDRDEEEAGGAGRTGEAGRTGAAGRAGRAGKAEGANLAHARGLVIDHLVSTDARLVIIPRKTDKQPKVWAIHKLHMTSVAFDRAMPFEATLTNGVPPGEIATKGIFGPWHPRDPGATPLDGTFTFANADLGVFKGIAGILSAHGEFGGSLGRIGIHGETDTPQFTVNVSGHPVPLHTDYHATVDGTNGDTLLDRIDATFLKTSLVAKGSVVDAPGKEGRTVVLDITMDDGRLEDILRLAVKTPKAPMTGGLELVTKFVLAPGHGDVVDKLRLDGAFAIATARFTDLDIQHKVDELSHRSRGNSPDVERQGVVSNFKGRFTLADGTLRLPSLTFNTPGAMVRLAGAYQLRGETMAFKGTLLMDAKISETQTGMKRLILKVVDPLFKKDGGGSAIPFKIEGPRSDPAFGLDKGRVFRRGQ